MSTLPSNPKDAPDSVYVKDVHYIRADKVYAEVERLNRIIQGRNKAPGNETGGYRGDSLEKLLADMRVAVNAARDNKQESVALFVAQWIERLQGFSAETPASPIEPLSHYDALLRDLDSGGQLMAMAAAAIRSLRAAGELKATPLKANASVCVCGEPNTQGVTHRTDGPCFVTPQR